MPLYVKPGQDWLSDSVELFDRACGKVLAKSYKTAACNLAQLLLCIAQAGADAPLQWTAQEHGRNHEQQ